MGVIETLRSECEYHPLEDGPIDNLIAYKDALEDLVERIDLLLLANNGEPAAEAYRSRLGEPTISAADVTGALFSMGFGEVPEAEPDGDPYGSAIRVIKAAIRQAVESGKVSQGEQAILIEIEERVRVLDNA